MLIIFDLCVAFDLEKMSHNFIEMMTQCLEVSDSRFLTELQIFIMTIRSSQSKNKIFFINIL